MRGHGSLVGIAVAALLVDVPTALGQAVGFDDIIPGIGLGDIDRVPCELTDAQTPQPSTGSLYELAKLCPGAFSVRLRLARTRILQRSMIWLAPPVWRIQFVGRGTVHGGPRPQALRKIELRSRPK